MATQTSNLGLTKPAYSETADIADINNNMDKVDAAVNGVQNGMAILANGNVHSAVTRDQYVYVRNHGTLAEGLYTATTNISTNATLSTSNLTAVPSNGALNILQDDITSLNSNMGKQIKQLYYGNDESVSFSIGSGSRHILLIASSGALTESAIVFVSVTNAGAVAKAEVHKGNGITSIDISVNNMVTINWSQTGNRFYFDIPLAGDLMGKV